MAYQKSIFDVLKNSYPENFREKPMKSPLENTLTVFLVQLYLNCTQPLMYSSDFLKIFWKTIFQNNCSPEAYSEPCQTSTMKCFAKMVNGWKLLTIFAKHSILDYWHGSEYASVANYLCNTVSTLNSILVGTGIPGLWSFVFSLNSLQNCMILIPRYWQICMTVNKNRKYN